VARITRKELKTDKFALEVEHTVTYFEEHRNQVLRYGAIAAVVALLIVAFSIYRGHQRTARQQELADAIRIQEAPVGGAAPGTPLVFQTQPEKEKAATKAFTDIATKHSGSQEGIIAENYLAAIAADTGRLDEAERRFKLVADQGDKRFASNAKLSLAQLYLVKGRTKEAEELLRSLMSNPTEFVSKEQATYSLAQTISKTNPTEALKLLEPLRTSANSTVSQNAISLYAEISQ
jgi:predicted negative regulator of RcsB-dependent stress response